MSQATPLGDILRARFSCRAFLPDPVPQDTIDAALRDAQHVASWCNSQPWQVFACGPQETERLARALYDHVETSPRETDIPFPAAYEGAYRERRRVCGWQLYDAVGVTKGDRAASARQTRENYRFFGAPQFLLLTTPKALGPYGAVDCGAFLSAVLLGLQARGVGSCAMAAVAKYCPFLRDWFDIAEDRDILCGVAVGFADRDHPANSFRTDRASLDEVVTWR